MNRKIRKIVFLINFAAIFIVFNWAFAFQEIEIDEPILINTDTKQNYLNVKLNLKNYYLETRALPIEKEWKKQYPGKISVSLPGPGVYALLIRARSYEGKTTKTYFRIFISSASVYQNKLTFSYGFDGKSLYIYNYSKEPIKISGFKIVSENVGEFIIPQATKFVFPGLFGIDEDVILNYGQQAIIMAGNSPLGFNFRSNICFGYLKPFYKDLPTYGSCQPFTDKDLYELKQKERLSSQCLEFLRYLNCTLPTNVILESRCLEIAQKGVNYLSCFNKNAKREDFLSPYYYLYLPTNKIFDTQFSTVKILDQDGFVVDKKVFF